MIKISDRIIMFTPGDLSANLQICISAGDCKNDSPFTREDRQGWFLFLSKRRKIRVERSGLLSESSDLLASGD